MHRHEHTRSCRYWKVLGAHHATSGWAELVPGGRSSQKDPCCTVQGLSGGPVCHVCRDINPTFRVNLKSQQMEARGYGVDGRKEEDRDQG